MIVPGVIVPGVIVPGVIVLGEIGTAQRFGLPAGSGREGARVQTVQHAG